MWDSISSWSCWHSKEQHDAKLLTLLSTILLKMDELFNFLFLDLREICFLLCVCRYMHMHICAFLCLFLPVTLCHKECMTAMTIELWYSLCYVKCGWEERVGKRLMVHIECTVIPSFPYLKGFQISYIHRQTLAKACSCHAFSTDSAGPRWGLKTFLCSYTLAKRNYRNIWYCGSGKFAILTLPKAFRN